MITREDYLNALELIDQYHQQLNLSDVRRISSSDKTPISKWLSEIEKENNSNGQITERRKW